MERKQMSREGYENLQAQLNELITVQRPEIAQKLKEARSYGDLSENAEYDAAKDEQRDIEARIEEIEQILKHAEVVVEDEASTTSVNVGCKVKVLDIEYDEELEFAIVGSTEANSLSGKISNESPVGKALIGGTEGQTVTAVLPDGTEEKYKVLSISRNI